MRKPEFSAEALAVFEQDQGGQNRGAGRAGNGLAVNIAVHQLGDPTEPEAEVKRSA